MVDICIPVWNNLACLRASAKCLGKMAQGSPSMRVLLHVQDKAEADESVLCFENAGLDSEVVSTGEVGDMAAILNGLFNETASQWVLFMEQDTFLWESPLVTLDRLKRDGYVAGGPVDTYHYSNPNARYQFHYGEHGRLSPQPGYFHSSLIYLDADAAVTTAPFTIPKGFQLHGTGVLGGESYYGLRINIPEPKSKLAFFTQTHADFGYAADIGWSKVRLATHLFYSSTKRGYCRDKFLSESEYQWLCSEEERFIQSL